MKNVLQILHRKQSDSIISVSPETSVLEGLKLMMEKNISALLIMEADQLKGIFTERDYARKIVLQGRTSKDARIEDVMTAHLITITPTNSIDYCMQLMTEKHIRHLPVLERGKVVGMVSIGDVVKSVIEDQKQTIQHLENYISG